MFHDRHDAGRQLAAALNEYKGKNDVIILALPRGGVVVGAEVARALELPLDIVVPRKIGAPGNPEFAIGAITETGKGIFDEETIRAYGIPKEYIDETVAKEQKEAQRRLQTYRGNRPPLIFRGKTAILVDDGIATGFTMKAAIASVRTKGVKEIVVAVPVGARDSIDEIKRIADTVLCLDAPSFFGAVGQCYEEFGQTTDEEVISRIKNQESRIMEKSLHDS